MRNETDLYLEEFEQLLSLQESYFDNLIRMGSLIETTGQRQKAYDIYKKGIEKSKIAEKELSYTMMGMME